MKLLIAIAFLITSTAVFAQTTSKEKIEEDNAASRLIRKKREKTLSIRKTEKPSKETKKDE